MKILICFDLPVEDRGLISGHAVHEVKALTEEELKRVCSEQRMLIQKQIARRAQIQQEAIPMSQELVLRSVVRLDEESRIITPQ